MNLVAFEFDEIGEACFLFGTTVFGFLTFSKAVLSREPSRCNLLRMVVEFEVDEVLTLTLLMSSIAWFAIGKYLISRLVGKVKLCKAGSVI